MFTAILCAVALAAAYAAGVYTGLSKDKIIAFAKGLKAKVGL
ncbi:MAG TPA: hypothetical protein PKV23_06090 [Aestuariivirga sp.]|nr:hypothetical protein [Aestuariivirga sp.]